MQYDVSNPEEYLMNLEPDWRKEKIQIIRTLILSNGPELKEGIGYKMLCYGKDSEPLFYLNAQKLYVSLYVGNIDKIPNAKNLLVGFQIGKGCIRLQKSTEIEKSRLGTFIQQAIDFWRKGGDPTC